MKSNSIKNAQCRNNPALLKEQLEQIKKLRKKRRLSSSKMNKHLEDIFELYFALNASCADVALWLRKNKRMKVSRQAVFQFIQRHLNSVDPEAAK